MPPCSGRSPTAEQRRQARPPGATYSTGFFEADEGEVVALVPMPTGAGKPAEIETTMIPGGRSAVALHRGPFSDAVRTYGALGSRVAEHDRTLAEPIREIYLAGPAERDDPATYRTELLARRADPARRGRSGREPVLRQRRPDEGPDRPTAR